MAGAVAGAQVGLYALNVIAPGVGTAATIIVSIAGSVAGGTVGGKEQLQQHGLPILPLQFRRLCRHGREGNAFVRNALQQRLLQRGKVFPIQRRDFLFLGGAHLGAAGEIGGVKQLIRKRGPVRFRRGSQDLIRPLRAAGGQPFKGGPQQRKDGFIGLFPLRLLSGWKCN